MREFIASIIISLGGLTGIVVLIIRFGGEKLAEILSKRYEKKYEFELERKLSEYRGELDKEQKKYVFELDKQLTSFQSILQGKIYVSKSRFEKELIIIQEFLSQYYEFTHLFWDVYISIEKPAEKFAPLQQELNDMVIAFSRFYLKNQVLINKELAEVYKGAVEIVEKYRQIVNFVRDRYLRYENKLYDDNGRILDAYVTHCMDNYDTLKEIHNEVNTGHEFGYYHLVDVSREYMDKLQII